MANREIAAELVVAARTVEFHLSAAYRKLGVRRRGELAVTGGLLMLLCAIGATDAQAAQTRYSLANECYTLTGPNGAAVPNAGQLRLQASALALSALPPRPLLRRRRR